MAETEWQAPSDEEFSKEWITPGRALELLTGLYSDRSTRKRWIMERLKSGFLLAVARDSEMGGKKFSLMAIPHQMWDQCDAYGEDHFWNTGDESLFLRDHRFRFFDIRVRPENLFGAASTQSLPPLLPSPEQAPAPKGGAPRKSWWDDLWIEMIRRIRADELHPESAAALQRAMMDWLGEQGFYPGDDTLKKTAIKLFKYLQE